MISLSRRTIESLLIGFILLIMGERALAQQNYKVVVDGMLKAYPASTLQDIYKSFFQDRFGPGHLISDTIAARQYLHRELAEMEEMWETILPYYEKAGAGENFYRVNLTVIKEGLVTEEEFFDAFIESASKTVFPSINEWREEWTIIMKAIPSDIEGYDADSLRIDSLLSTGNYAIHHSKHFNEKYHPHYRLIDKITFEKKLLPKIQSSTSTHKP